MNDLVNALVNYEAAIRADYARTGANMPDYIGAIEFLKGQKFLKVTTKTGGQTGVHSFISIDPTESKWKFGDILKAATWRAPAQNFIRGNVFKPENFSGHIRWTGVE